MGKSHRDNHAARKKRGPGAFEKKAERRKIKPKCNACGTLTQKLQAGLCMKCFK